MEIDNNTILLGKLLAETYRLQRVAGIPTANDATIYGLRNGIEQAIQQTLESIGRVSTKKMTHAVNVLNEHWEDQAKLAAFQGYYQIENQLESGGVDRADAIVIFKYLQAQGRFTDLIMKMDSSQSPSECRKFDMNEWDI